MFCSVQFSPFIDWVLEGHEGRFSRNPLPVFSAGCPFEQFRYWQECPLFDVIHPAYPLSTTASPSLQDALKDGLGEAIMACDMSETCKFPSLGGCQKRFLWTHKRAVLAPHPVVGLVLQVGDAEKFPQALGFEGLDPFCSESASRAHVSQP